jgi:hypothetical protein
MESAPYSPALPLLFFFGSLLLVSATKGPLLFI